MYGWEPEERHDHFDAEGKLTGYTIVTREPEWDDEQRDWALALTHAEENQCPLCGGPRDECTSPSAEGQWAANLPVRCHKTTALSQLQAGYLGPGAEQSVPEALMWSVRRK